MDLNEVLFSRTLVKEYRDGLEDDWMAAEELAVTKEANGYALWYSGRDIVCPPRIIAWCRGKYDIIAYAVKIGTLEARDLADRGLVEYHVPRLSDQALEPVVPEK